MNVKKKAKINNTNKKAVVACQIIEMDKKRDIVLIRSEIDKMTEDEIRDLLKKISDENKELRKIYYAKNTPVLQIKHRTFSELIKKFLGTLKEEKNFQMLGRAVQYRKN